MRFGKSLIGNPVFGSFDGRKLGEVRDIYLNDDLTSVVGVYLGREGLLRPTPLFVESGDVALFGLDVLLTEGSFAVHEGGEVPEPPGWLRLDQVRGREVRTPGGTKIGRLGDVVLDEEARVTGFALTNLSVRGPLAEADAVARHAVVDVENEQGMMTMDLGEAERALLDVDPDILFSRPAEPAEEIEEADVVEPGEPPESAEWGPASDQEWSEPYE